MTYKLFVDLMSQPCRALYILFKLNKVPFEVVQVPIRNGEHLTDDFKKNVSRFSKLPVLHDGDFKLTESIAILRYVCKENQISNNWYPQDSKKQARVDEYLEWQHLNTRAKCALYFLNKVVFPILLGKEVQPDKIARLEKDVVKALDDVETLWLTQGNFINGNEVSAADIFAACEIEQLRMSDFDFKKNRPVLSAWIDRVRDATNPYYDEAHIIVNKIYNKKSKL